MENLFEKGCLVQVSSSVWRATRKIDPGLLPEAPASPEWLSATKKLIDPQALKPINEVVNSARTYLAGVSLPFPLPGMVFVPREMIGRVDERLQSFKAGFGGAVDNFVADYQRLRELAQVHLGELFNELDYPVDITRKFDFAWRFIILDVPNGKTGVLAPEVYEREKEKFIQTMEEAREMAVASLREEFGSLVKRLTERFTTGPDGKPKVFKNTTVDSFHAFFETFKERNIFRDQELAELVDRARAILGGTSPDSLRSDARLKDRVRSGMAEVETAMADILARPRRKIVLN